MSTRIRGAAATDVEPIRDLYRRMNRPHRSRIQWSDYLVATADEELVGCAAVELFPGGGYLYGLAVRPDCQRSGIGSRLTLARVERVKAQRERIAIALAMFWNVRFFRRLGFETVPRKELPDEVLALSDFRNRTYRRSAVLQKILPE